jgi:hypothetical protein
MLEILGVIYSNKYLLYAPLHFFHVINFDDSWEDSRESRPI